MSTLLGSALLASSERVSGKGITAPPEICDASSSVCAGKRLIPFEAGSQSARDLTKGCVFVQGQGCLRAGFGQRFERCGR